MESRKLHKTEGFFCVVHCLLSEEMIYGLPNDIYAVLPNLRMSLRSFENPMILLGEKLYKGII